MLNVKNVCYLPSGRIFLSLLDDNAPDASTEIEGQKLKDRNIGQQKR